MIIISKVQLYERLVFRFPNIKCWSWLWKQ